MISKKGKITIASVCAVALLLLVAYFVLPAFAVKRTDARDSRDLIMDMIAAQYGCSGEVYFVDSGVSSQTAGTSWATAVATIDAGINLCTADRGDLVLVAAGHNEAATAANTFDADIAGIKIRGLGEGAAKPTIDYDGAAGLCNVGAANVVIDNLRFRCSYTGVLSGILIEPTGDNCVIRNCDFGFAESDGTDEFHEAILVSLADGCLIEKCTFKAGEAAAMSAITVASVDGIIIQDNDITGDYSVACISEYSNGQTISCEMVIVRRNVLYNGNMKEDGGINAAAAIRLGDGTGGFCTENQIISDVATSLLMRVADDVTFMHNYVADDDGDDYTGGVEGMNATTSIVSFNDG